MNNLENLRNSIMELGLQDEVFGADTNNEVESRTYYSDCVMLAFVCGCGKNGAV